MEKIALQTDFEANLPPALNSIVVQLKQEKISLDDAMLEAIRDATTLLSGATSVDDAARLLEKIQVAATVVQKTAFITHTNQARRCSDAIRQIAQECREFFHDLKVSHRLLRKN